jgi:hypothetical protein
MRGPVWSLTILILTIIIHVMHVSQWIAKSTKVKPQTSNLHYIVPHRAVPYSGFN